MIEKQIEVIVLETLKRFMTSLKKPFKTINRNTNPISDLCLDSPDGIDWVCDLEEEGLVIPLKVNPFVDDNEKPRNVDEIIRLLYGFNKNTEKNVNE